MAAKRILTPALHVKHPITDWYARDPIIPVSVTAKTNPWDTLPWPWPEFAAQTLVASGGRYVPFVPYEFQSDLVRIIREVQNVYILKSRQTGISETIISYMLSNAIRRKAWTGVCFSKTGEDASELASRIKGQASTLRERCPPLPKDSMRKLVFKGAGSLHFLPPTERAARGIPSASFLLFDEAGFIDKLKGIETGALPTTSMLGDRARHVWCTTPNGRSGTFSEHWFEDHGEEVIDPTPQGPAGWPRVRISPDKQFAKVAIHYSMHPIYGEDPDWAEKTRRKRQLTKMQWNQEYELDFAASDRQLYDHDLIEAAEVGTWELPRRTGIYVMGIDPNGGGSDDFCAIVLDVTQSPWRVVAGYAESGRSRDYSLRHCAKLVDQYNPDLVCVEKNGVGCAVAEAILTLRPGTEIEEFSTSETFKVLITDRVALLLEQHELIIPDEEFPGEPDHTNKLGDQLRNFRVDEKGKRNAATGWKDDGVMALAAACQAGAMKRPLLASWIQML